MATVLGKRLLNDNTHKVDGDVDAKASPKRLRCDSPPLPTDDDGDDERGDALIEWDGIECDEEDLTSRDRIVFVAFDLQTPVRDLVTIILDASTYQVELAMLHLFEHGVAFRRLCRALYESPPPRHSVNLEALVYRAAHENRSAVVGDMVTLLCEEDDLARALSTAVEEGDLVAVNVIVSACETDTNTPADSYQRLVRLTLYEAIQAGRVAIVAGLAHLCDHDAIEEGISLCLEEIDGDQSAATVAGVFAALWKHAELCAHKYIASLPSCSVREYLSGLVAQGQPCADDCMSNIADDSDEEEEEDDEDEDDDTDGEQQSHNGNDDENDSTTDDGGHGTGDVRGGR